VEQRRSSRKVATGLELMGLLDNLLDVERLIDTELL